MARRIARWAGIAVAGLALLLGAILLLIDTSAGHRLLADRIAAFETQSGIAIRVGRIDGSVYGRMTLRDLTVSDPKGVFLTAPAMAVDWRPFAYARGLVDLRLVDAATVRLLRLPALKPVPTDPDAPILPDIDLTLARLHVGRLIVDPSVTGRRHVLRLDGAARIADGRAQISADGAALRAAGIAGGDLLRLRLDAVPAANRLRFDARLAAPAGGLVDSAFALGKPLAITVGGRGDWRVWNGSLRATIAAENVAALGIAARDGAFRVSGTLRPGAVTTGPAARLPEPAIALDATARLAKRRIDLVANVHSDAFNADAGGLLDLATSRFGNFRLDARLLKPGSIADNLAGRDVRIAAVLDGAFARPAIAYRASAAAIAFGEIGVEGLVAQGNAVIDVDHIRLPVHAVARQVVGLNAAAGGLLSNLRVDGDLTYAGGRLLSDDLRLRSDRIDASAIVIADLAKGSYTGALKGRVNDYQIDGLGRINLVTDAHLVTAPGGGFGIRGRVRVTTRRIDNASLADALGGPAVLTADVGYDASGGLTFRNLRLAAAKFRITQGEGGYRADGRITVRASGSSAQYGPLAVTVSGTVAQPLVRLKAARPNVGIQLSGVEAEVVGTAAGYRIRATGGSSYGPFSADLVLLTGGGPMALDVARARFAGIDFAGRVLQTSAGPFAGTLTLNGQGLHGTVRLAASGKIQRAEVAVDAKAARIPGDLPITIGNGVVRATALLYPGKPAITADANLADVRQGSLLLAHLRGRLRYQGGSGTAALVADGRGSVPFNLAAQAGLTPDRIRANVRGAVNGVAFRLAAPAEIVRTRAGGQLQPTTVVLPQGQIALDASYGAATMLHAVLRSVDLGLVEAFVPGLGLGGTASGTVDLATSTGAGLPRVSARIDVAHFTRTGARTVSDPVSVALAARLEGNRGTIDALIRRGASTVGRLQARLGPIPAGGATSRRLLATPLSGGLRYSGPAEVLWTLTGFAGQELTGPIAIAADVGGRLGQPTLTGVLRADALAYENDAYGTRITGIALTGRFTQSQLVVTRLTGRAGDGTIAASGTVGLDAVAGFPIDLRVRLDRAQLARSDALGATLSGDFAVTNSKAAGGLIKGELRIPEARYQIVRQRAAEVAELTGVRRKNAPPAPPAAPAPLPSNWQLDLRLHAPNSLYVSGMGLEAEWKADLRVGGSATKPTIVGQLEVVRGTYSFAGRRFDIDKGVVTFQGADVTNPALDISASTTVDNVAATINITGFGQRPQIAFTSTPALPQDEVLSRLLFGQSVTSLSPLQAVQLAAALNSLRGSGGGLNPLGKLRSAVGVDRLRILGADKATGRGTAVAAGQHIGKSIYIEVITDARGFTATQLEVALSKALSVLSQTSSFGGSNVTLRYTKDY